MIERSPEQDLTGETISAQQVFDGVVSRFQDKEGARTVAFAAPVLSMIQEGQSYGHGLAKYEDFIVSPTDDPETSLVLTKGTNDRTFIRSELVAYLFPTAQTKQPTFADQLKSTIEHGIPDIPPSLKNWHQLLMIDDNEKDIRFFPISMGAEIAKGVNPSKYIEEGPKLSQELLRSIWDQRPVVEEGSRYNPELVEKLAKGIEDRAVRLTHYRGKL